MKKLLLIFLFALAMKSTYAQFNYANQWNMSASGGITAATGWGISIGTQRVFKLSNSSIQFQFDYISNPINIGYSKTAIQTYLFEVTYAYSLDKIFNSTWFHLNIHAGATLGLENLPNANSSYVINHSSGFRYGLTLKLVPEFKLTKTLSIFIEPKYIFLFNGSNPHQFMGSLGIKCYIK